MSLETMDPNPVWDADAYPEAVSTFERLRDELEVSIWGADWCGDCRAVLPDFAAALDAADIPDEQVEVFAVEKSEDGTKTGPQVEEYDIERIPTIVIERENREVARFVESEPEPAVVVLADQLDAPQTAT
jgi:thiol-disulfide isomerase/thioredoxin